MYIILCIDSMHFSRSKTSASNLLCLRFVVIMEFQIAWFKSYQHNTFHFINLPAFNTVRWLIKELNFTAGIKHGFYAQVDRNKELPRLSLSLSLSLSDEWAQYVSRPFNFEIFLFVQIVSFRFHLHECAGSVLGYWTRSSDSKIWHGWRYMQGFIKNFVNCPYKIKNTYGTLMNVS